jgi:hypothetical protein
VSITLFSEAFAVADATNVGDLDINPADAVKDWKTYAAASSNKPYNAGGNLSTTALKVTSGIAKADTALGGTSVAAAILTTSVTIGTSYSIQADCMVGGLIAGGPQNCAYLYARVKKSTNEDTGMYFRVATDQATWDDGTAAGNATISITAAVHTLKITVLGNVFTFFIDGTQVLTRTMTANASEVGIGFGTGRNSGGGVTNFLVTRPELVPGTSGTPVASLAGTHVGLVWTAPGTGDPVTLYTIQRSDNGGAYATVGTSVTLSYTDSPPALTTVLYKIIASNGGGSASASAASNSIDTPAAGSVANRVFFGLI